MEHVSLCFNNASCAVFAVDAIIFAWLSNEAISTAGACQLDGS